MTDTRAAAERLRRLKNGEYWMDVYDGTHVRPDQDRETLSDAYLAITQADEESVARMFHETYERLASDFGYETRKASAVPWEQVPDNNKRLMIAVCREVLAALGVDKENKE